MKSKVFLMMSGGVDSSVASYLLKQNPEYEVYGVFMKCWSMEKLLEKGFDESEYSCNWEEDLIDAKMVAEKLDIPFEMWDFQDEYADKVVDYMIEEYHNGRTPNPDVMCNSVVKFGVFYDKAMSLGADYVATGHYAKIFEDNGCKYIGIADDKVKDQSYFLWKIPFDKIQKTLFPIGEIKNKNLVRQIAQEQSLLTAGKKDSQGLCFVGKASLKSMLKTRLGELKGDIITKDIYKIANTIKVTKKVKQEIHLYNQVKIGEHKGYYLYTIGQREGLYLSGGPWYVSKINKDQNVIEVTHYDNINNIEVKKFDIIGCNIIESKTYQCLTRYNQKAIECTLTKSREGYTVNLKLSISVSKGQSFVLYDEEKLVMGAIIN
jgi:tRNA-uridine 2-sulfurtransferase